MSDGKSHVKIEDVEYDSASDLQMHNAGMGALAADHVVALPDAHVKEAASAASLENPLHVGYLSKLGTSCGCFPTWRRRYFILKGAYLFKYESERGAKPKGMPIPICDAQWETVQYEGKQFCFKISTVRKEYFLLASNYDDMTSWFSYLKSQKVIAIKQSLGHLPMSDDDRYANAAGDFLCKKKLQDAERDETLLQQEVANKPFF